MRSGATCSTTTRRPCGPWFGRRPSRNYEFSAIVEGIVASVPFQMRAGRPAAAQPLPQRRVGEGRAMTFKPGTFFSQKALPRRTFLRGAGATLALPLLDAMVPAFAADRAPWTPRLGFVYVGNGIVHKTFKPSGTGSGVRALARAAAARAAARAPHRDQRPRPRAGQQLRRRHGRPSALVGRVAHGRARLRPHAARRRGQARDDGRPARGRRARRDARRCARSSSPSTRRRRAPATPATAST